MSKKILRVCPSLTNRSDETHQTTPPILYGEERPSVRKLIEPILSSSKENVDDDQDLTSKSNSPSPRESISFDHIEQDITDETKTLKILVIGDSTVGKTSYIQRYVQNKFLDDYKNTVGVDFSTKILNNVKYGQAQIKLQIWDIAGQDRYICLNRVYYKNTDGCIIMFDLTNRVSFENVVQWKHDLDSKCILSDGSVLPCLLLASKCDLLNRKVKLDEIETMCHQYDFMSWIEVSSKNHLMIEDSMNFLVDKIMCSKLTGNSTLLKSNKERGISLLNTKASKSTRSYCGGCF